ncbi:rbcL, partial [Symbiodinium sp. CCMP2456]
MSQRTSAAVALGGMAGLAYMSSGSQTFAAAPATANHRQQHAAQTAQAPPSSASATSLPAMMAGGAVLAAAAASGRATRSHGSAPLPTSVMPVRTTVTARRALDQSSRYADLSLDEATLIKNGKHVL